MLLNKKTNLPLVILLVTILVTCFVCPELLAQDDAAEAAPTKVNLLQKVNQAGAFMYPLFLLSIIVITLIVFNALQLGKKKFVPPVLKENVLGSMREVRVRSAIDYSAQDPSYLGRMLTNSFTKVDATDPETLGKADVEDAIADFSVRENPRYMTWIGYFSVIAQSAPMIGLFGTVAGMISAFDTLGAKGNDTSKLSQDISLALMTTAGGLVVAIPSIFCFYIFKNRFNKLVAEAQAVAGEGMDVAVATVNADQQLAKVPEGISQ